MTHADDWRRVTADARRGYRLWPALLVGFTVISVLLLLVIDTGRPPAAPFFEEMR